MEEKESELMAEETAQEELTSAGLVFSDDNADFEDDAPEFSDDETSDTNEEKFVDPKKKKRRKRLIIFGAIGAVIIGLIAYNVISGIIKAHEAEKNMYKDVAVERHTITKSITGSSSIEPNDSYNVMTMKSGDITADYFKEGDTVKKGDKLYQFDDEDARGSLKSAQNAVTKAEQAYVDAVKQKAQTVSTNDISSKNAQNAINKALTGLNDAQKSFDDQYVKADISGKVTNLSVKQGDQISNGMMIATIYSDTYMKIRVPFNDYDAEGVAVGDSAQVTVTGSGDVLYGTVTEKSSAATASSAHTMVVYTTIEVLNPGALTENDRGSAVVNGVACADSANFEYIDTQKLVAKTAGKLESLNIAEGDNVYAGAQLAYIKSDNASSSLSNAQLSYDDAVLALKKQVLASDTFSQDSAIKNAQLALDDAKTNLKKAQDAVDDFVVEAPIEGTVVKKNAKNGDTRDSSNSTEALCVIYDLSSLKISIEVDETEIAQVHTGLEATITADAVEGEFKGTVTKVPVDGVNENGVTTYTIEVQINDYGDLLPGMNVDAEIIVEQAKDVLAVPVNSVNRGDIVFVKDNGQPHGDDVTDAIKSKKDGNGDDEKVKGVPANTNVPDGYRAIKVETGLNDNDYIEIKSGLNEQDMVRTLNTESSSAAAMFGGGDDEDFSAQMEQRRNQSMRQMQTGGGVPSGGGMGGGAPGGGGSR